MKTTMAFSFFLALAAATPMDKRQATGTAPVGESHTGGMHISSLIPSTATTNNNLRIVQLNPHDNYGPNRVSPPLDTFGACGKFDDQNQLFRMVEANGDKKVALNAPGGIAPYCGKKITITGKNGATVDAHIVDECSGCPPFGMDLIKDAWLAVGNGPETGDFVLEPIKGASWVIIE